MVVDTPKVAPAQRKKKNSAALSNPEANTKPAKRQRLMPSESKCVCTYKNQSIVML